MARPRLTTGQDLDIVMASIDRGGDFAMSDTATDACWIVIGSRHSRCTSSAPEKPWYASRRDQRIVNVYNTYHHNWCILANFHRVVSSSSKLTEGGPSCMARTLKPRAPWSFFVILVKQTTAGSLESVAER